jgi:hypothetical protein
VDEVTDFTGCLKEAVAKLNIAKKMLVAQSVTAITTRTPNIPNCKVDCLFMFVFVVRYFNRAY